MRPATAAGTRAALLAWAAGLLALAGTSATLALLLGEGGDLPWKPLLLPVLWAVPGVLVAAGRPCLAVGWLMLAVALCFVGIGVADAYLRAAAPGDPSAAWAVWWLDRGSAALVPSALLALLLLPDGRLPTPTWRPVAAVAVGGQALLVAAFWFLRGPAAGPDSSAPAAFAEVANPVGLLPADLTGFVEGLDVVVLQLPMLLVPVAVGHRLMRSRHDAGQRQRLVALLLAATVFALFLVVGRLAWPAAGDVFDVLGSALLAAVITGTVLGVHQDEVEYAVHHAFVFAVLTAVVTGGYVLVAAVAARAGADLPTPGAGVVAAVIALALLPVRTALQRLVDRLMHGDRRDPYAAVTRLVAGTNLAPTTADALTQVAASVATSLRVPWVSVAYGDDEVHQGRTPVRSATASAPLISGPEPVGALSVAFDASRRWRPEDQDLLETLSRHGGMAVHAVALAQSLRASRQRLVETREEERRRVGRNLHDELGPMLASLAMQLGVVRALVAPATPVGQHLARLEALARATVDEVRRVARELRPTVLDQLGLAESLRRHAEELGLDAQVTVHGDRPVPAAVEAAAYRIGQQALGNVAAHADCGRARLRLAYVEGTLELAVEDEGRGFTPGVTGMLEGVGMSSMRERAAEVGGSCVVDSAPGSGTTVAVRLPCPSVTEAPVAAVVS